MKILMLIFIFEINLAIVDQVPVIICVHTLVRHSTQAPKTP